MKPARILLIFVAVLTGGLAAFLATRGEDPATQVVQQTPEIVEEAKLQVLVANTAIGVGQRLNSSLVSWQDWPEGAVRPEYITSSIIPDAIEQMDGTVARFEIFAGEPIRQSKLIRSDQGYLSAVISPGMRAVSVPVTAESGAGGYIVPNDRVDVVRTGRGNGGVGTQTILANIKVLAIGVRLGEVGATAGNPDPEDPQAQVFEEETIATLELSPAQAETIIGAGSDGKLTLVLRSVADFAPSPADGQLQAANRPIRLIRFGVETNIASALSAEQSVEELPPSGVQTPIFASQQLVAPATGSAVSEATGPAGSPSEETAPEVPLL